MCGIEDFMLKEPGICMVCTYYLPGYRIVINEKEILQISKVRFRLNKGTVLRITDIRYTKGYEGFIGKCGEIYQNHWVDWQKIEKISVPLVNINGKEFFEIKLGKGREVGYPICSECDCYAYYGYLPVSYTFSETLSTDSSDEGTDRCEEHRITKEPER